MVVLEEFDEARIWLQRIDYNTARSAWDSVRVDHNLCDQTASPPWHLTNVRGAAKGLEPAAGIATIQRSVSVVLVLLRQES